MPQCAFQSCKNNARKNNLTAGVSYFRFPSNPFTCAEWISTVARERGDDFYKPAKNSVICSDHFDKLEISGNTDRRRLVKTAVPKLEIEITLIDPLLEEPDIKPNLADIEVKPLSSSAELIVTPKAEHQNNEDEAKPINVSTSPDASVSDLISNCDTPKERFLYKQLVIARNIIKTKSNKIQTLQKVNKRLVKKKILLKNMVNMLKKKGKIDETVLIDLSKNVEIAEVFNGMYSKSKKQRKKPFSKWPPGARNFALTLYSCSPAAYKYVRKMLNTCLPHPHTLHEWQKNVNAEPVPKQ